MVFPMAFSIVDILATIDCSRRWRSLLKTGDDAGMALISAMVSSVVRARSSSARAVDGVVEAASSPDSGFPKGHCDNVLRYGRGIVLLAELFKLVLRHHR
jgi:hypothetical protein